MKSTLAALFPVLLLFAAAAPLGAQQAEEATADTVPWSGWWWPAAKGHLVQGYHYGDPGALYKHDQITGKHATEWEKARPYHFDLGGPDWWGHCHAWAAASILELEPRREVTQDQTTFHVGDLKGLLSEAHFADRATILGQRFDGNDGDDFEDMYPLEVWSVLREYIYHNKRPVVMDLDPGPEVWSYPAYKYQISFQPINEATYQSAAQAALPLEGRQPIPASSPGAPAYQGQLSLSVASFNVYPDLMGTATAELLYSFVFRAQDSQLITGSDHWTGRSLQYHPDFAWYPTERGQENPELDYDVVSQLAKQAR